MAINESYVNLVLAATIVKDEVVDGLRILDATVAMPDGSSEPFRVINLPDGKSFQEVVVMGVGQNPEGYLFSAKIK